MYKERLRQIEMRLSLRRIGRLGVSLVVRLCFEIPRGTIG